jgi:ligand-binding SRPBCC domain-containing protein
MRFVHESVLPVTPEEVYAFHARADAFALLQPPWERSDIIVPPSGLEAGTRVELRARIGPFRIPIVAEHVACEPGRSFEDVMRRGPFARWHHKHLFLDHAEGCLLRDEIDYAPPLGWLGRLVDPLLVRPRLRRMFTFRHAVTRREVLAAAGARGGE